MTKFMMNTLNQVIGYIKVPWILFIIPVLTHSAFCYTANDIGFKLITNPLSEEELLKKQFITPDDILRLRSFTENFLCSPSANIYNFQVTRFTIRELDSGNTIFDLNANGDGNISVEYEEQSTLKSDLSTPTLPESLPYTSISYDENYFEHTIRYQFPSDFLTKSLVGVTVEFKIGDKEINNFRMIEMHFFKDKLLKTFDFTFGYCIPNSINTWEHIYEIPKLPSDMITEIINSPYESRSETFYFDNETLIIHNKAEYSYSGEDGWD